MAARGRAQMQNLTSLTPESMHNHCAICMFMEDGKEKFRYIFGRELGEGIIPPEAILFQQQQKCW